MNYRHAYHAGNFADIFKHIIIIAAMNRLHKKSAAYTVLDLYAGKGLYDLEGIPSQKTEEIRSGIYALQNYCNSIDNTEIPRLIEQYLRVVHNVSHAQDKKLYPGSPLIITQMLSENGQLKCSELHEEEFKSLAQNLSNYSNVSCHHVRAQQLLIDSLPLESKRGMIVIDPAFEEPGEFDNIIQMCQLIEKRAMNNMVLVWYPIKDLASLQQYTEKLGGLKFKEILRCSFSIPASLVRKSYSGEDGMHQCGVDIINPGDMRGMLRPSMQFLEKIYSAPAHTNMQYL